MANDPFVQFGVPGQAAIDAAKAQAIAATAPTGYTQDANMTVAMNAVLNSQEVFFANVTQRGGSVAGEIVLDANGRIVIPALVTGRWSVALHVDVSLGTTLTAEGRLLNAAGVAVPASKYPRKTFITALAAGAYTMPNLPIVYKPDNTQVYTLQIWVGAAVVMGITSLTVAITKLGS